MCIPRQYRLGLPRIFYKPCSGTYSASNGCIESKHTVFLGGNRRSSVASYVACSRCTIVLSLVFSSLRERGAWNSPLYGRTTLQRQAASVYPIVDSDVKWSGSFTQRGVLHSPLLGGETMRLSCFSIPHRRQRCQVRLQVYCGINSP